MTATVAKASLRGNVWTNRDEHVYFIISSIKYTNSLSIHDQIVTAVVSASFKLK